MWRKKKLNQEIARNDGHCHCLNSIVLPAERSRKVYKSILIDNIIGKKKVGVYLHSLQCTHRSIYDCWDSRRSSGSGFWYACREPSGQRRWSWSANWGAVVHCIIPMNFPNIQAMVGPCNHTSIETFFTKLVTSCVLWVQPDKNKCRELSSNKNKQILVKSSFSKFICSFYGSQNIYLETPLHKPWLSLCVQESQLL